MLILFIISFSLSFAQNSHQQTLSGDWEQVCINGKIKTQHFKNQTSILYEHLFKDKNCQKSLMTFKNQGVFETQKDHINFEFELIGLRINDENLITQFNKRRVCNFSDWQINRTFDVTGRSCDFFLTGQNVPAPKKGDQRFGVYILKKIFKEKGAEENLLYFSKATPEFDGTTKEKRPTELETIPYRKSTPGF